MENAWLNEFVDSIAPFYSLWRCIRVSGAAINVNGGWFNIAMQMEVLEGKPEGRTSFLVAPDFLHYRFDYPLGEMRELVLETIRNGFFRLGTADDPAADAKIFLSRNASTSAEAAARMAWFGPRTVQPPNDAVGLASRACISVTARGDRLDELVSQPVIQRIDSALRLEDPSYDGISDLLRRTLSYVPASLDGQAHLGI